MQTNLIRNYLKTAHVRAINKKAWDNLVEPERTALSLQLGMDKSSWEAGEIMKRSHYKYLEIKYRAEYFLKLFTKHFQLFGELIPEQTPFETSIVKDYLKFCIEKRIKPSEALEEMAKVRKGRVKKDILDKALIKQLKHWGESQDVFGRTVFDLVMDFDRWNNFRILPKEIQEPSPYKRRAKKVFRAQLRILKNFPELSLKHLKKLFETNSEECLYLPIVENETPLILKIRTNPTYLAMLDDICLYYFRTEDTAREYIGIAMDYIYNENRSCKDGLEFWPKFREIVKDALNYNKIHNLTPNRKFLEMAINKIEYWE